MHDKIKKIINTSKSGTERRMGVIEKLHRKNKKLRKEMLAAKSRYNSDIGKLYEELAETKRLQAATRSELNRMNPVHPFLNKDLTISNTFCGDALRYRISAPKFEWDDKNDTGMVRMVLIKDSGATEVFGYAFSEKAIYLHQSYILDNITQQFARCLHEHLSMYINKPYLRKHHENKG